MYPITVTINLSQVFSKYVDLILGDTYTENLKKAVVIENGEIRYEPIRAFREARGLFCK